MARRRRTAAKPQGVALVLGSADGVWQEIAAAQALTRFDAVVAVNDMVMFWPGPLDCAVTLHPEKMRDWLDGRAARRGAPPKRLACHAEWKAWFKELGIPETLPLPFDVVASFAFTGQSDSGSSGLFAVKVALQELGFAKAVLCGIPMSIEGAHFRTPDRPWPSAIRHRAGWEQALPHLQGRVRSMSGWTATLLGTPDAEWLAS
ncbi:MAG: hypothetical protein WA975_18260 [Mesorhizobium sp.]